MKTDPFGRRPPLPLPVRGRHVGDGTEGGPRAGQVGSGGCGRGTGVNVLQIVLDLGQAEVEDLCLISVGDENVGGLDIAVNDALRMGGIECIGDLDSQIKSDVIFEWPACNAMSKGLTLQAFHRDEGAPCGFVNFVNRANVRMVQRGCCFGFALKAAEGLRVTGNIIWNKLQRDEAVQSKVLGLVDHTHTTTAEFFQDAEVRNGLANHGEILGS